MNGRLQLIWQRLSQLPGWLQLSAIWAILYLPRLDYVAFKWEEGRRALLAIDIIENGHWLAPEVLGVVYVNKPPLLPWLIAGFSAFTGEVNEWAVRMPAVLSLIAGSLCLYFLLRKRVSDFYAMIGGLAFFLTPLVFQKSRIGETDLLVTVLTFAAFVCWFLAFEKGRVGFGRWVLYGMLLGMAILAKGPIPLGFCIITTLAMTVLRRRWSDLWGLGGALLIPAIFLTTWAFIVWDPGRFDYWLTEMRLRPAPKEAASYFRNFGKMTLGTLAGFAPWIALALPCAIHALRNRHKIDADLALSLTLYIAVFSVPILVWPGAHTRYLLPIAPAIAAAAALYAASVWHQNQGVKILVRGSLLILMGISLAWWSLVYELKRDSYTATRIVGLNMRAQIDAKPAPVRALWPDHPHNLLAYLGGPVQSMRPDDIASLQKPAWVITNITGKTFLNGAVNFDRERSTTQGKDRHGKTWYLVLVMP